MSCFKCSRQSGDGKSENQPLGWAAWRSLVNLTGEVLVEWLGTKTRLKEVEGKCEARCWKSKCKYVYQVLMWRETDMVGSLSRKWDQERGCFCWFFFFKRNTSIFVYWWEWSGREGWIAGVMTLSRWVKVNRQSLVKERRQSIWECSCWQMRDVTGACESSLIITSIFSVA